MKIKNVITIIIIAFMSQGLIGQGEQVTIPFSNPAAAKKLKIEVSAGNIKITGTNRTDILVNYSVMKGEEHEDDTKKMKNGMKKISGSNFSFEMSENNNVAFIESANWFKPMDLEIEVPKNIVIEVKSNMGEIVEITSTTGSINVESNMGEIVLKDINGVANVSSNVGSIKVEFSSIPNPTAMLFSTTMGDVDIALPATFNADLKLKTDWGEVYSDMDLKTKPVKPKLEKSKKDEEFKVSTDSWINATLNGGGSPLTLKTKMGDIYLRKKK
jgi:DUF4097 and DUF4098 domain-containing protein YvlB